MRFISGLKHPFKMNNAVMSSVYPLGRFCEILERERLRTHRNGFVFSLLIFEAMEPDKFFLHEKLVKYLKKRLRSTDEIGWYKEKTIGVLLLDTDEPGARFLAAETLHNMPPGAFSVRIQIYPEKGKPNQKRRENERPSTVIVPDEAFGRETPPDIRCDSADCSFTGTEPRWKRALDITGALVGLILLFPLFLIFAAYVKVVSPGPIFFKQVRIGYRRKPFTMWKLRTMHVCTETECHQAHLKALIQDEGAAMEKLDRNDPRIIPFAKILRNSGLDELPQLINVIKGDMSLVGPRPCLPYEAEEYKVWHHERFDAKPGLTGLWQVSGKNRTSFLEMMRFDARYAKNKNFLRDLFIICMTIPALVIQVLDGMNKKEKREGESS